MQVVLLVNAILQWVTILFVASLLLALLKVVGEARANVNAEPSPSLSLKGVNVAQELVFDARASRILPLSELVDGGQVLLLTDPTCSECDRILDSLASSESFPWNKTLLAVRGTEEMAAKVAMEFMRPKHVIHEANGLGLRAFGPPFAAIIGRDGYYVSAANLRSVHDAESITAVLRMEDGTDQLITIG